MSLPLRLKTQVRDFWNADDSDVRKAFAALETVVGKPIQCEPDWAILWNVLKPGFPDQAVFIPLVCNAVASWAKAFAELADDEANENWVETMLTGLHPDIRIVLAVDDGKSSTRWISNEAAFEICFPKTAASPHTLSTALIAKFHADLLSAFTTKAPKQTCRTAESWTDVDGVASEFDGSPILTPTSTMPTRIVMRPAPPTKIPTLAMIPRPEDMLSQAPYFFIVTASTRQIRLECSHQASLDLLVEYLKKWVKRNHRLNTKPPLVEIECRPSAFGLSTMYDQATISVPQGDNWTIISPMVVLSFLNNALGYELTYQIDHSWHFMRRVAFQ
ncbi:hypothetical protein BT63DRAFT_267086 [Microthyrium microscopicum]|uniref:Uncharacterized protein n=1 Tax=Microthyrium microscopicum TaxID=703497 RepID=A0A6A6UBQ2_9PEZI|nr:hypothetical protein BT63DRAFT_267086 [Microthyrium microscopicum]